MLHFGIPTSDESADLVKIIFSNGKSFEIENLAFNRTYHFTYDKLIPKSVPNAPQPKRPLHKSTLTGDSVQFRWDNDRLVSEQDRMQVSKSSDFDDIVYDYTTISDFFTITDFAESGEYFWRLKSSNHLGESDWSQLYSFTLDTESSVEKTLLDIPTITISPNPADDLLTLRLNGINLNLDCLAVYDVLGNTVISFDSKDLITASSEIKININNLNSGVYYLVVRESNTSIREKFVISR